MALVCGGRDLAALSKTPPQLTAIRAAGLKVEGEQVSLWSQIEGRPKTTARAAATGARVPESPLELSSLSAVLERSALAAGGDEDARGMAEELQRIQQANARSAETAYELESLRTELGHWRYECEQL